MCWLSFQRESNSRSFRKVGGDGDRTGFNLTRNVSQDLCKTMQDLTGINVQKSYKSTYYSCKNLSRSYKNYSCVVATLAKCAAIIALSYLPRERLDLWLFTLSSLQTPGAIQ